ncbi:prion-like-(Q/N-rich) domain-bearing protein 25 [Linepithema humile]|uniref:prion-like-(Q/N-rich) domain-bearing protein 25 n=1 Tax=Linepithema humile TaxID=83485 RepID=UPI0006235E59|nr:PREDICTED: cell death abnormality protein 1-like [Linepithema humile]
MMLLICIFFLFCALAGYSTCQENTGHTFALVGEKCQRDIDCIANAFCRWQQTCSCDPYYSPSPDKSMCIATVGLSCENNIACQTMANGECRQGTCACKDDFFLDSGNSSNCISRPAKIGDRCQVNTVCQESFNFAMCINEKCECYTGYHFVNQTRNCILSRDLYNSCDDDYECYIKDMTLDTLKCDNHQCVCKEGESCAKGSLITAAGTLVTMSWLLQRIAQ